MKRLAVGIVVLLGGLSTAPAGIIEWDAEWVDATPLDVDASGWSLTTDPAAWQLWESYVAPEADRVIARTAGTTVGRQVIHIEKQVTNNSTFDWTGYSVEVTGSAGVTYVPGSAISDAFGTITENGNELLFGDGTVPMTGTVTIEFDVSIPQGGFEFDIHQQPVPEPAALVLLLAGPFLLRRRG